MNPVQNRPVFSSPLKSGAKTSPLGPEGIFKQEEPQEEIRGAAAMALKFLENMKEKVTCAICLELLTEPLSLNCGHSFCQACVTDNQEPEIGPGGESSCPVCGVRYSLGSPWLNQHLANIVERVKEVKLSPEEGQTEDLCLSHGERLRLFCKEDRKAVCQFCEWSREHRGHQIFLVEEVVKEYQEKLQTALGRLRKERREAEKLGADIREERTSWKNQIQTEKQRIQTEFNQLRSILDSEEQRELQKLEEEETKTLHDLAEAENELVQQSQLLEELISDLERRSEWSAMELLQDTSGIMKWSEVWTLKKPKSISKKLKHGFRAPDLSGMLQMFKELTRVQCHWVDMTFNPFNLNLSLTLSEDHRQLASVPIWPIKYYNYGVLGSQYFSSGKHYWEIDVSKKTAWILGIYYKKFGVRRDTIYQKASGNKKFGVGRDTVYQKAYSRFRPENGYWVVGLQNVCEYNAFEDSATSDPKILTLSMAVPPRRVGVFLDYEASTVSFYNVTNHGSLIYKFSKCHFSQTVYPYFNPWNCQAPMALCPPSS